MAGCGGAIALCSGTTEFAIPRHTELCRVEGAIVISSGDGEQPRSQPFALDLSGPGVDVCYEERVWESG
jgi:hypothetical protein